MKKKMVSPRTFFSVHLTPNETEAYEAGKAEGRRLERRALRRWALAHISTGVVQWSEVNAHLSTKPAKRKAKGGDSK
jgi:hypothetical protein